MNFLDSNPYLPMDSIGMYEAATCRIHLCDDDPYEELLHNVDEVETLLQDPVALAAMPRLLDPDADLDELRVSALQSDAISPEERALPRFSRRAWKRLPTWDLWHKNELEQLDQMKALGMFGSPIKLPEGGILIMRFHWQYDVILLHVDVRDYTSMHAYAMTAQDPQGLEESSMPIESTTGAVGRRLQYPGCGRRMRSPVKKSMEFLF